MNDSRIQLIVKDIIAGDAAVSTDDGDIVFRKIEEQFQLAQKIDLDFNGITLMTTAFLNAAIGQLYASHTSEYLNENLSLVQVSADDKGLFRIVIERAKEYFANKDSFNKSADDAIHGS